MTIGYRAREILRRFRERKQPLQADAIARQRIQQRLEEAKEALGDKYLLHESKRIQRRQK